MAIYSADERSQLEAALFGTLIHPDNLDTNLVGVIRSLVGMATRAQQNDMDARSDIEVMRTATRELERANRNLAGQGEGYRQLVWTLIRRLGGTTHIEANEIEICPQDPTIYISQTEDGGWDIIAELPEPSLEEVNAAMNGGAPQEEPGA